MPGGLRAGLERSCIGGATFAQECNAASPCPSATTVAGSLIRFLVAEHTGVLIVEIDLTRIGPVSRALPFGSEPARSAPLRVATRKTAQTMAAETTDRSRIECPLCTGLSPRVAASSAFNVATDDSKFRVCLLAGWHLDAGELEETSVETTQTTRRRRPSFGRTLRTFASLK
jgi:hypothetical protein